MGTFLKLTDLFTQLGEYRNAKDALRTAEKLTKRLGPPFEFRWGRIALQEHDYEEASLRFRSVLAVEPSVAAFGNLAMACEAMRNWDDTYLAYLGAMKLAPEHKSIRQNFEKFEKRLGPDHFENLISRLGKAPS